MADEIDNIDPQDISEAIAWPPIPEPELVKGNTLTAERLIELGAMSGDPLSGKWAFRLIRLRDEIQAKSAKNGTPLSLRILKGGLHINTDAEAVGYHDGRGENGLQTVKRQVQMLATAVDPSKLTSADQSRLDRSLVVWGARLAALKRATKNIPPPPAAIEGQQ